ncbi:hypothetical protein JHK85_001258 [Glycine max]|uniref:Uncharacterized protein n=1 Tax=Glycine max TaxID=3847 RepID=A0A0R0L943_SOYBN|nr:hypothetical protein JHK85_001258 [Glycine max]KAH1162495.1 hypothetical protein GYH30_001120 [Glycine max]
MIIKLLTQRTRYVCWVSLFKGTHVLLNLLKQANKLNHYITYLFILNVVVHILIIAKFIKPVDVMLTCGSNDIQRKEIAKSHTSCSKTARKR